MAATDTAFRAAERRYKAIPAPDLLPPDCLDFSSLSSPPPGSRPLDLDRPNPLLAADALARAHGPDALASFCTRFPDLASRSRSWRAYTIPAHPGSVCFFLLLVFPPA
jgi:hypothetical protein